MSPLDLTQMHPSFSDVGLGSQAVFRSALQALAHPGSLVRLAHDAPTPQGGHAASAALLLALLDSDCTLWLSPSLAAGNAPAWLRFHTGCQLIQQAGNAQFLWVGRQDAMPALDHLALGSDVSPEGSATLVMDLHVLGESGDQRWLLQGPGIATTQALSSTGLPHDFAAQWSANSAAFPRGIDLFLADATQIVGLPRTTQISAERV
jgi:alpha-D-ribose 1-methylphosphonate 5-triphosphate synthase subunit PhnH